jgi:hypothetical protein
MAADADVTKNHDLALAAKRVPRGSASTSMS